MAPRFGMALSLLVAIGSDVIGSEHEYPRKDLLIEAAVLARPEIAKQFVVVDARERKSYDKARIPGAVWVDTAAWAKTFKDGKDAPGWSARIGSLGIGPDAKVVVCDQNSFNDAARIWWILRYWGVADARLLNGNWSGWEKAGLPVDRGKPRLPAPAAFTATPRPDRLVTKRPLLESLKTGSLQIVDARSEREFCGIDKAKNKRAGAIPGAKHLEWIDLVDKPTQRFKSPEQLRKLFQDAGIDLNRPTAAHCQSGGRASVMVFGMELMGARHVSNYYASWGEWGNAGDTPIVVPAPRKKKQLP
jgi:thiosulfate/3-mercaptopyruvate sulfurtransferase